MDHLEFGCPEYAAEYSEPEAANTDKVHEDNDTGKEDAEVPKVLNSFPDWDKPSEPLPNAWGTMPTQQSAKTASQPTITTNTASAEPAPSTKDTPTVPEGPTPVSVTIPNPPFLKPSRIVKSVTKTNTAATST